MANGLNEGPQERPHGDLSGAANGTSRSAQGEASSVDGLIHTIEGEIIPRLLLAHQNVLRDEADVPPASGNVT